MNWAAVQERVISNIITIALTIGIVSCLSLRMERTISIGNFPTTTVRIVPR